MSRYDDIINLEHHTSKTRKHMPIEDRAAQFAPFSALSGFEAAIAEEARKTDKKTELSEYEAAELNRKIHEISQNILKLPKVCITYFVPDEKKSGGRYDTYTGNLRKADSALRMLTFTDGTHISMDDITDITIDVSERSDYKDENINSRGRPRTK